MKALRHILRGPHKQVRGVRGPCIWSPSVWAEFLPQNSKMRIFNKTLHVGFINFFNNVMAVGKMLKYLSNPIGYKIPGAVGESILHLASK